MPRTSAPHPLDPIEPGEIRAVRRALAEAGLVTADTRFAHVGLDEPPKHELLAHAPGADRKSVV